MAKSVKLKEADTFIDAEGIRDFKQGKTQTEINAMLYNNFGISYTQQILLEAKINDVTDKEIIVPQDGYIQCRASVQGQIGTPFIRLTINEALVYEDATKLQQNFIYRWSPLFFVKKGMTIKVTLETQTMDGYKAVYLYT